MVGTLIHHLARYGLPLVFANVFLEQIGLPIPALPTLIAAGALAGEGGMSGWALVGVSVAASVLADFIWFALGRRYGFRILKTVCRISLSPDSCVRQTESFYERFGLRSLLFAKFVPGFSTVAPPLAGAMSSNPWKFLAYDTGGSLIWAGSGLAIGFVFRRAIDDVVRFLAGLGSSAALLLGAALLLFIAFKWAQRRRFYKFLRMARIRVEDVVKMRDDGRDPVIVDVRSRGAFLADPRRIPGALRVVIEEIDSLLAAVSPDQEIILYCT